MEPVSLSQVKYASAYSNVPMKSNDITLYGSILQRQERVGEFIKKESYSECLLKYIENVDEESGMYPLTEDLKYIIQSRGDHSGWWSDDDALYLFKNENGEKVPGINADIAWLFMCCYIEA